MVSEKQPSFQLCDIFLLIQESFFAREVGEFSQPVKEHFILRFVTNIETTYLEICAFHGTGRGMNIRKKVQYLLLGCTGVEV